MLTCARIMITCVLLLAGYASSATRTWNGGGANNNWSTTANWTPATAPTTGDDLVFAGSTRLGPVNDIASGTTFNSISFSSGAGNFNLTGNPLNLSGGATALTCNATTGTMMIQLTITYTAAPTVSNPGAGSSSLMIFDQVTGGYTINVAGTGTVDFAGPITGTGGISKNGAGTLKLQGGSSFTGAVNIVSGLVIVTNPSGLGSTSAGTTVQSGAAIEFGNVNYSAAEPLTLNGTGISTNGAMTNNSGSASTFGGPITLASATSIVAGTGNLTLSNTTPITGSFALTLGGAAIGTMSAGITGGSAGLTKAGAGTWYMNGAGSTSTGTVTVSSGTLEIQGPGSIPLGDITLGTATFAVHANGTGNDGIIDYNRTLTTASGATATLYVANAGANTGNSIKFNGYNLGNATVNVSGANGYRLELGSLTLNGGTAGTATLSSGSADFIIGNVTGNAQTHTLALAGTGGGSSINGILSDGAAAVTVTKAGAGAWTLAGSNTYTGTTSVSAGALVVAANNALGSASAGTTVSSGAVLDLSGTNYAAAEPVTLNGTGIAGGGALVNTNVAGSSFAGPITLGSASSIVGASGTIALGNTGAISGSYGLTLGGAQGGSLACTLPSGNLTKSGTGTWTLNGSTALSLSSLTLSAGTLALGSGLNHTVSTTVSVTGGTLDFGSSTLDVAVSSLDLSALAGMVPGTGSLKFSSGSAQALIPPAVGLPNLTKINAGTLTVGNAALNAKTLTLNGGTWDWGSTPRTHYLTSITGAGGNMDFAADTVEVSGDVSLGGLAGILSGSTGYLKFNNPGSQSFQPKAGAAHPNLIKSGVGTVTLITNNLICASLSITNGTFGFGTGPLTLTSNGLASMNGGTLDVSTNTPTLVTGGWLDVTAGTLNATNGTLDANSSVIVRSGSTFLCPATNPFTIRENLSVLSGATFTTNSGTITMDATTGGQDVASVYPLNNLVFNGTGGGWIPSLAVNVNGTLTVLAGTLNVSVVSGSVTAGNLTMGGGTFTATNATLDINGDFSMTGGTFDIPTSAANFKVAGSYVQSAGSMTSGVGAVRLDGTGTGHTVTATATLNVLEITGSGSWSLGSNLTVNSLSQSAGSLNLASNILNINSGNTFSGGTLNFGSGALHTMASTVNLNGLGTLVAGTGTLRFSGSSAQTFTPKASVTHPNLTQYGAGGTTVATNGFTTDVLTLNQGTFNLGSGLSHTASTVSDGGGGPYGSLDFGSSQLHVMGNIALGNLTSLVAGSGTLHFDGASGSQFFTPKSGGAGHPHIVHTTGGEIRLFTNPLTCLSFTMSNGSLDFNGQNLTTSGNLSITSGTPSTITGLGGRTLTVGGTATLSGASAASKLNLNPGTAWTLNATGAASATYASLNYGTATNPATCSNCTEGGNNANWSFPVTWDGGGSGNSWGTADNWGSKTVPTSVQSVIFNGTSVKDVVLNAAATIYAITMTGAYTGNFNFNGNTLTVQEGNADFRSGGTITGAGGNLSLSGAAARLLYPFSGTGLPNLQHAGAGSLTVTGGNLTALNLTLSGAGAFNLGTGLTHNFAGISGSGWLTFGTASVNATGDVDLSGMSVTASGTNTLAFTGASAQNFTPNASVSGLKLTQNGAGGTLVQGYNFLTDTLTLATGTFNLGAGRTHISTSITASGGSLHFGSSTLKVSAASVSLAGLGTLNAASGTLEFNGASAQTFVPKSGATHPTLRQNGAGGTTLLANITVNGLELNSGILNLGSGLWMVADGFSTGGGGLDFGTSTLRMSGATINLNGLSSLSAAGGTLEFTGSSAQAFTPKTATNSPALLQTGTGVTTLGGNVSTTGLSINGGEINLASYALSASGNLSVTGGVLTATNGSLDVDGNLTASGGTVKFPSANPFTVAGNIAITSGATVIHNSGTLTLDGTASGRTLSIDNAVNSLVVNGTGGEWTATGSSFTADGALSLVAGALKLGTGLSHLVGSVTASGGTLDFGSSTLRVNYGNANLSGLAALVADAGTLHFLHTGAQVFTPKSGATHPLILKTGAGDLAISANDLTTKGFNLSAGGLNLNGRNITVNNGGNFNLANGGPGTISNLSGSTLTVAGSASLAGTSGASRLNLNPGANWTLNVTGSLSANYVTLSYANASGSQGQCSNCANAGSNSNWNFITVWDGGGADENWSTPANWGSDAVPTAAEDVSFTGLSTKNVILDANGTVKSLTMVTAYTGAFAFGSSSLSINGNADFRSGGAITPGTGLIYLNGTGSNTFIPKAGATFPDIVQNGAGGTTTIATNALTAGNLTLSQGTFNLGASMTHTVASVSGAAALDFGTSNLNATGDVTLSNLVVATASNTLTFSGSGPQIFVPYAAEPDLNLTQNGTGGTTVSTYNFSTPVLTITAGAFNLGTGRTHMATTFIATGGGLDFGSSTLRLLGATQDFSSLGTMTPGTGTLAFLGSSAQSFTPKASHTYPTVSQSGSGGTTTITSNNLTANGITVDYGALDLGSGRTHSVGFISTAGGTLVFNNSEVQVTSGNADFSGLATLTAGTGSLAFSAASGTQVLTPKSAQNHPAVSHTGAGSLQLAAYDLACAAFSNTAGTVNLNGRNITTVAGGNFSVTNGTTATFSGLTGRTLTVAGNATFNGTSSGNRVNLNPGAAWTLAVTGTLSASLASLDFNNASAAAGSCTNCANGGGNTNWNFAVAWDGGGGNANWSTAANWGSDAVPTAAEDVTFNSGSLGAVLDANASIKSLTMTGGYTGSLDFGSSILSISGNADFRSGGGIIANTGTLAFTGSGAQTFIPKSGATFPALVQNGNTGVTTVTTNPLTAGNLTLTLGTFDLGASLTHTVAAISGAGGLNFGTSNLNATGDVNLGTATVAATSASTLAFTNNSTAQIFTPNTSEPDLKVHQNGYGGTTVATNNLSTPSLTVSAGTFNLGPGLTHAAAAITATGGGINFNSSTLQFPGASLNLDPLSALMPGSGTLAFTGASAQAFTPKAGTGNMKISLTGSGGVNLAGDLITLGIDIQAGTLDLGTGRSHTVTGGNVTSSGGGLVFNNSVLQAQGSVNFSGLASLSAGSGILRFYTSGTPTFTPKASVTHPHIEQTGASTVTLAVNPLTCLSFTQSAGTWNLGGQNLTTVSSGNFTVTNGAPTSFSGLAGRTLTVAGNAALAGTSAGSKLNLNPASAWTLAVTGTLNASFASLMNGTASASAGACASCANGGGNSNWTFSSTWIGGSGSALWTNAANWSGGVVPAAGEDVLFNATNYDCTLGAAATVRNITLTSGYTGAFYFNIYNLTVTGNADFRTGGTVLPGSATMLFTGTSAQTFIPKAGQTFPNITQNGAGGTTVLTNPLTAGSLSLTSGTFNLGASLTHSVAAVSGAGGLHFGTSNLNATGNVNLNSATVTATSANTLAFSGASAQTYTPKATVTNLNLAQNGTGVTTVASVNFTTPLLTVAAGTFNLGTSRQHNATNFAATGGTLDFGSASSLEMSGATIDFSGLAAITAGDGYLRFGGSGAQTFIPKAGATHPSIWQNGAGTTTVTTNGLIAGSLTPTGGTFHMGTGLTNTFTSTSPGGGPYGSLHFGSSQVHFTSHADFSSLTTVTAGTGTLHFDAPTGTQIFAPKAGTTHAAVTHAGAGTLQLATNNLVCAAFTQTGGPLDLNGRNIQTIGDFTVGNGTATTFTGLAARTVTVGGNATLSGASTGNLLNLNPGSAWTLAVTGSLNASLAALANGNASVSSGTCTNCSDGGANTNWTSAISWDGGGADNNWSTTANWGLDAVPTSADNIVFDATSVKNATLDATGNVASIKFTSGYTGTFSFVTNNVVIHTGNADMRTGGAFSAGSGMLYFQGTGAQTLIPPASGTLPRVQRTFAGTLTFATNGYSGAAIVVSAGTINLGAGLSHSANLVDGNSGATLDFGTSNLTLTAGGTADFADMTVTAAGSNTLSFGGATAMTYIPGPGLTSLNLAQTGAGTTTVITNDFTVPTLTLNAGTLNLGAGRSHSAATISAGGGALDFGSSALTFTGSSLDLTGLSAITAGTGYLTLSSSGAQTLIPKSGATLPDLTKIGAGTVTIATNPLDAASLTVSGGTVNLGSSLTHTVGSVTITGTLNFSGANLNAKGNVSLSGGTVTATSANTLAFTGTASQSFSPNASEPDLNLIQNGTGGTTALAALTTPTLTIVSGTLYLGTGLAHTVGTFAATGGGLDFESSLLSLTGAAQDFSSLGTMTPGTGTLAFTGASAQTFTPKAAHTYPAINQNGTGGTTIAANNLTAGALSIDNGTLNLGAGRIHSFTSISTTNGGIHFNSSTLNVTSGNAMLANLGTVTAGTGTLAFTATTGTQVLTPKAGQTHPAIYHAGAGALQLATNDLSCASFSNTAGALDLNGRNLATVASGNFTVSNGSPATFTGLAGRTLTVAGNASLSGTSAGSKLNLNPGAGWTLAVTGTLTGAFATVMNGTASGSGGTCSDCVNGGTNTNWSFLTSWDGGGADNNWTTAGNWGGDAVPTASDAITFNGTSVKDATLDADATVKSITFTTAYTGAFSFTTRKLTIAAGDADFRSGGTFAAGTGVLEFASASPQSLIPKAGAVFPDILQSGAGTTTVALNAMNAGSLSVTAGSFNLGSALTHAVANIGGSGGLDFGTSDLQATGNANLSALTVTAANSNTLFFLNTAARTFTPNASLTTLRLSFGGSAAVTTAANGFTTPALALSAGSLILGSGLIHTVPGTVSFTGGGLDFNGGTLRTTSATVDLRGLASLGGSGNLEMTGASPQTLHPKAATQHPNLRQNGAGGTTLSSNPLQAGSLMIDAGTFDLGSGFTHNVASITGAGSLVFNNSTLEIASGDADLSGFAGLSPGTGTLRFGSPSGTQILSPKASAAHPSIAHTGAGTLRLAANDLACATFSQSAGTLDLNGRNLSATGDFTLTAGHPASFAGLGGRTLTVSGNVSVTGAPGSQVNLDPATAWFLAASGTLTVTFANVARGTASALAGTAVNSADGGSNSNWTFAVSWTGGGADEFWSTGANWGSGSAPGITTNVIFDATNSKNSQLTANASAKSISFNSGYTGAFSFGGFTLTIGDGNADFRSGGAFTAAGGTLEFGGTANRNFHPKAGSALPHILHSGTGTTTVLGGALTAGNLALAGGTFNLGSGFTHTVGAISGSGSLDFASSSVNATGNVDLSGLTVSASGPSLNFTGASPQSFTPKASLTGLNLAQNGTGGTTVLGYGFTTPNLALQAGALNLGAGLTHSAGTVGIASSTTLNFASSTLKVAGGTLDFSPLATLTAGTGLVEFTGASAQGFTPKSGAVHPTLLQSGAGGTTVGNGTLSTTGALKITGGTLAFSSGTFLSAPAFHAAGGSLALSGGELEVSGDTAAFNGLTTFTTGAGTVKFSGAGAKTLLPKAGAPFHNFVQNGSGAITIAGAPLVVGNVLLVQNGPLLLGTGMTHQAGSFASGTAGSLDFGSSTLQITSGYADFTQLTSLSVGTGLLEFTGTSAHNFQPKASLAMPAIRQNGAGTTTLGGNLTAGALSLTSGQFHLGAGRTHTFTGLSATGGDLDFGSSQMHFPSGNADFSGVGLLVKGTGSLHFDAATGIQQVTGNVINTLPPIFHAAAGTLRLSNNLATTRLDQTAGILDFAGRNLTVSSAGDFTVANGAAGTLINLDGIAITVTGNASLTGQAGSHLALNPASPWILDVAGVLTASYADLARNTAATAAGSCSNCANGGTNANWTFAVGWDGGGADENWTTAANWGSDAVPTAVENVTFDAGSVKNVSLNADATVNSITMGAGYTGAFSFLNRTLTVNGTADFRSGGTFVPGTGAIAFAGTGAQAFHPKPGATFPNLVEIGGGTTTVTGTDLNAGDVAVSNGTFHLGTGASRSFKAVSGSGTLDFGASHLSAAGNVDLSALTVNAPSANRLYLTGAAPQTYRHRAGLTSLSLDQTGAGGTTLVGTNILVPGLSMSAGALRLGAGLSHSVATKLTLTGGELDFGSSALNVQSDSADFRTVGTVTPGTGTLAFAGFAPQVFLPKAGAVFPSLIQNGAGTTVAGNGFIAAGLTLQTGAWNLGAGLVHTLNGFAATGGSLAFGSSTLAFPSGSANFSGLATITGGTGKLVFSAASGTQTLTPKSGSVLPAIEHTGAGQLRLMGSALSCTSLKQAAGGFDLNGFNVDVAPGGFLSILGGGASTLAGLSGRTLTVLGDATLRGTPGDRLNLNPGAPWTLNVSGILKAVHADLSGSLAAGAAGVADSSVNLGGNANWTFIDTIPPAAVTGFLARKVGGHAVELSWTGSASSDADSVMLRYRTDGTYPANRTDGTLWRSVPKTRAIDTATGLSDKALYHFAAFARDSSGNFALPAGQERDTAWLPDVTPPVNVTGFAAVVLGPTTTELAWISSASADADSLMIRYRVNGAFPADYQDGTLLRVVRADRIKDTAIGLTGNVLYHFGLFTRDSSGNWCAPAAGAQDTSLYQAPVTGSISIADDQGRTKDADPALAFTQTGADSMRFSQLADTALATWTTLRTLDSLNLAPGADGKRIAAAQFKNIYGRRSPWYLDTTLLDRTAPVISLGVTTSHSWRNWPDNLPGKAIDSTVGTDSVSVVRRRVSDGSYFNGSGWTSVADTAKMRVDSTFSVPMPNSAMATGLYDFTIMAKDKLGTAAVPFILRVNYTENRAPETAAANIPDTAFQNQTVAWKVELGDRDASDSVLAVSATVPAWLTMTQANDTAQGAFLARRVYSFSGKPAQADVGPAANLTLQVRDLGGKTFLYTKNFAVIDVNDAPVFAAGQDSLKPKEDSATRFVPKYTDPDSKDKHSLALLSGPAWAAVEDSAIAMKPGSRDVGPALVRVTISDGKLADTLDLTVNVQNVNDVPVAFPGPKWASPAVWKEDVADTFTVVVVDMDKNDPVALKTILPPFLTYQATIDSSGYNRYFRFAAAPAQKDTGSYSLKLRFQDASGAFNDLALNAKVAAVNDTPSAVVVASLAQAGAARITLSVQDQDGGAAETRFHYRLITAKGDTVRSGICPTTTLSLHPLADGQYKLAIAAEDEGGLRQPAYTLTTVSVSGATSLALDSARWNMIGYPGRNLPATALGAGATLTTWDESASDGSPLGRYATGKSADSLVRGKGYWVRTARGAALEAPLAELLDKPFALKLTRGKQGWNQIGNPYPYYVDLSATGLVYWEWDAARRDLVNSKGILKPWGAYWVQVAKDTLITIKDQPWFNPSGASQSGPALAKGGADAAGFRDARNWSLQLALAAGPYRDEANFLGIRSVTSASPAAAGMPDAPKFGDYIALHFEKPGTLGNLADSLTHGFAADFRASLDSDDEWWDFSLENAGTGMGTAQLDLPGIEALEAQGLHVFIVDRGEALAVTADAPASLAMDGAATHYSLVVTPHADFASRLKGNFSISQNFPNPVRTHTTFKFFLPQTWDKNGKRVAQDYRLRLNVYDFQGRLAAKVAEGAFKAGSHTLMWTPLAKSGSPLAKGAYVYRLEIPGFAKSLKLQVK